MQVENQRIAKIEELAGKYFVKNNHKFHALMGQRYGS